MNGSSIAVVGMAGRFPGADSVDELWANILAGRESLTRFDPADLHAAGVPRSDYTDPDYVPVRGVLRNVEEFDASLFGFSPREAELTDPQQRLLLECAWEALESAGHRGSGERVGVFAGTGINTYLLRHLMAGADIEAAVGLLSIALGNEKDHVSSRIAYRLGLQGPALAVQSSCSTSLVAVHLACRSLLAGECDIALAGGSTVQLPQQSGYRFDPHGILSPDGHCRAFDGRAQGTVPGNGLALVVLRRAADAVRDRNTIHALVRGSAINNDGRRKAGYTAPSIDGQAEVVRQAIANAGLTGADIGYVETHGTGTELGDRVELAGLTEAFRSTTDKVGFCAIGSLKPNVGHLDAAAGVSGLIKAVCAVREGVLPPSIHSADPHPEFEWETSPFYLNTAAGAWPAGVRRSGVSSFGLGGTNAHIVIEQPPAQRARRPTPGTTSVILVSGHSATSAAKVAEQIADSLDGQSMADVAFTLQQGRTALNWRAAAVGDSSTDVSSALRTATARRVRRAPSLIWMFPGQGGQSVGMAAVAHRSHPVFRTALDEGIELLQQEAGIDLRPHLLAPRTTQTLREQLADPGFAQPAHFLVQAALVRQLQAWGLKPRAVIGHSLGEYAAAHAAGALELADGLRLVAARGRLTRLCGPGAMTAVTASPETVEPFLAEFDIEVAAFNGPTQVVLSGPISAVEQTENALADQGITSRRLHISHAAHSALMEPALAAFRDVTSDVSYSPAKARIMSTVTGQYLGPAEYRGDYWVDHLRRPVQFGNALAKLLELRDPVLLEVGPGQALTALAHSLAADDSTIVPTMPGPSQPAVDLLPAAVAELWTAGIPIDLHEFNTGVDAYRIPLPSYPFERTRFWVERPGTTLTEATTTGTDRLSAADSTLVSPVSPQAITKAEDTRRLLEGLWRNLLGVPSVDNRASFFEMGGDSLLSVRLLSAIRRQLGVDLDLEDVIAAATLDAMTDLVHRRSTAGQAPGGTP